MTAPLPVDSPTGSIYDLGYRGYTGPRLGRGFAIRSLFTHSLRTTYGLGRTTRAKLAPWFLLVFAVLPSIGKLRTRLPSVSVAKSARLSARTRRFATTRCSRS